MPDYSLPEQASEDPDLAGAMGSESVCLGAVSTHSKYTHTHTYMLCADSKNNVPLVVFQARNKKIIRE